MRILPFVRWVVCVVSLSVVAFTFVYLPTTNGQAMQQETSEVRLARAEVKVDSNAVLINQLQTKVEEVKSRMDMVVGGLIVLGALQSIHSGLTILAARPNRRDGNGG